MLQGKTIQFLLGFIDKGHSCIFNPGNCTGGSSFRPTHGNFWQCVWSLYNFNFPMPLPFAAQVAEIEMVSESFRDFHGIIWGCCRAFRLNLFLFCFKKFINVDGSNQTSSQHRLLYVTEL